MPRRNSGIMLEFDAEFAQGPPGYPAVLGTMARDEQGEALRDAAYGAHLELGTAVGEVANDAALLGTTAIEGNDSGNHCDAARRNPFLESKVHSSSLPQSAGGVCPLGLNTAPMRSMQLQTISK